MVSADLVLSITAFQFEQSLIEALSALYKAAIKFGLKVLLF